MKTPASILCLLLSGCASIPAISVGKATYQSAHPFGSTAISVEGTRVTEDRVEIDAYERHSAWGWAGVTAVRQDISVTDYARQRKPEDKTEIKTP